MEIGSGRTGAMPNRGWNLVRFALAVLLLTASALKCWQLATEPIIGTSVLDSRWLLMATVEFEIFFGLWLLANNLPKLTWVAALICFGAFTCVSLYKALSGYTSCGCFGRVPVNPWYTSMLDLAIVFSLLRWRPRGLYPSHVLTFARFTVLSALWLFVGLPAAITMGSYPETTLSDAGGIIGSGKIVVLEPQKWMGKRFPLLPFIEKSPNRMQMGQRSIQEQLAKGSWTVVFYHYDCPKCREAIPKYQELVRCSANDPTAPQVAMIEIPPFAIKDRLPLSPDGWCVFGRLSDENSWLVATPLQISLSNGFVIRSQD